jgi:hypothetical protein
VLLNLRKKKEKMMSSAAGIENSGESSFNTQHSQHVAYLEKMNKELTQSHQEAVKVSIV